MKFPVGTTFTTRGKAKRVCTVTDYHTTTNLAGVIVKQRYVATHDFMGQASAETDITETTIAMSSPKLP